MRLTLLYVGLFLASAACLLTITYFLVEQQLPQVTTSAGAVIIGRDGQVIAGTASGTAAGSTSGTAACSPATDPLPAPAQLGTCQLQAVAVRAGSGTLNRLLIESGIALGIMAVVSVGLGWLMAGRVLRPLRTITAAAQRISARNLHQRIGMTGPADELKELGDTFDQLLGRLDASFRAQRQFVRRVARTAHAAGPPADGTRGRAARPAGHARLAARGLRASPGRW
jgi:methyl-accepting chemotaxis protein